jgi:hypothetical protein
MEALRVFLVFYPRIPLDLTDSCSGSRTLPFLRQITMPFMRFVLDDGTEVELETDSGPASLDPAPTMRGRDPVAGAQRSFQDAMGAIKKTVASAMTELRDAFPDRPDELEIEFGIKASMEANGLILAKAAGEASFTVKALWKKPGAPSSGE